MAKLLWKIRIFGQIKVTWIVQIKQVYKVEIKENQLDLTKFIYIPVRIVLNNNHEDYQRFVKLSQHFCDKPTCVINFCTKQ